MINYPLFCPKCKKEYIVDVVFLKLVQKENTAH